MGSRPHFDRHARRDLARLGVTLEQVAELEAALPSILLAPRPVAPATDVRARLTAVHDAAHKLAAALLRLERGKAPADREAAAWLYEAHTDQLSRDWRADPLQPRYPENPEPAALRAEVRRLERAAAAALEKKGGGQVRGRLGSPDPIARIDDALLRGWAKTHIRVHGGAGRAREDPAPPYPFVPGVDRAFTSVVKVCYLAAEHPGADSERTIQRAVRTYAGSERRRAERRRSK